MTLFHRHAIYVDPTSVRMPKQPLLCHPVLRLSAAWYMQPYTSQGKPSQAIVPPFIHHVHCSCVHAAVHAVAAQLSAARPKRCICLHQRVIARYPNHLVEAEMVFHQL
jgi:hypothetical protein